MQIKLKKKYMVLMPVIVFIVSFFALSVGIAMFNQQVEKEVKTLFTNSKDISGMRYSANQINNLPEPVQRYFKYSLQENTNYISYVKLKHEGTFRQSQWQGCMPITGQEYFTTENPGFLWVGKMKPFPIFWIDGKDEFIDGKGNFKIKLLSLVTVADTKGKESDESELMRWLAESPWFPTALLPSKYLHWEKVNSSSDKAIIEYGNIKASAIFYFNEQGQIIKLNADRYRTVNNYYSKDKWIGYYTNYTKVNDMMIPKEIEAAWNLSSGEFSYAKFKITGIEYNDPSIYKR
ncbi:MAG: DUF6920 family protein [Candidatus Nitrosocosmicus sp.]